MPLCRGEISTNLPLPLSTNSTRGRSSESSRVNASNHNAWSSPSTTYTQREEDYLTNVKTLGQFRFGSYRGEDGDGDGKGGEDATYESESDQGQRAGLGQGRYQGQDNGEHAEGGRSGGGPEGTPRSSVVIDNVQDFQQIQGIQFTGDAGQSVNQSRRSHQSQHTPIQFGTADHHLHNHHDTRTGHDSLSIPLSIHSISLFSQSPPAMIPIPIPTLTQPCASLYSTSPTSLDNSTSLPDTPNSGSLADSTAYSSMDPGLNLATCTLTSARHVIVTSSGSSTTAHPHISPRSHSSTVEHMPSEIHQQEQRHPDPEDCDSDSDNGSEEGDQDNNDSASHCYVGSETQSLVSLNDADVDASSFLRPSSSIPYASGSGGSQSSNRSIGSSSGGGDDIYVGVSGSHHSGSGSSDRSRYRYTYRDSRVYPEYNHGARFEFNYEYEYEHGGDPDEGEDEGEYEDEGDVDSDMRIEISSARFDADSVVEGPAVDERWGGVPLSTKVLKRGSQSGWSMRSGRSVKSGYSGRSTGSGSAGSGYGELRSGSLASVVEGGYGCDTRVSDEEEEGYDQSRHHQSHPADVDEGWRKLLGPVLLPPSPPSSPVLPSFTISPDPSPTSPPSICVLPATSDPTADFDMTYITQGFSEDFDPDEQKWDFVNPMKGGTGTGTGTGTTTKSHGVAVSNASPASGSAKNSPNDNEFFEELESGRLNSATGLVTSDWRGTDAMKREVGEGKAKRKRSIYFDMPGVARGSNVGKDKERSGGGDPSTPMPVIGAGSGSSRVKVTVSPLNTSVTAPNIDSSTPTASFPHTHLFTDPIHYSFPPSSQQSSSSLSPLPANANANATSTSHLNSNHVLTPATFTPYIRRLSAISLHSSTSGISTSNTHSSSSFAHDDSFAKSLMVWGGKEYGVMRREWVVRKERERDKDKDKDKDKEKGGGRKRRGSGKVPVQVKRKRSDLGGDGDEDGDGEGDRFVRNLVSAQMLTPTVASSLVVSSRPSRKEDGDGDGDDDEGDEGPWKGMALGEEETWVNFLLGRFVVTREEVGAPAGGGGAKEGADSGERGGGGGKERKGKGKQSGDVNGEGKERSGRNEKGSRSGQGKPPQQRLIIRRLRDSPASSSSSSAASGLTSVSEYPQQSTSHSLTSSPSHFDDEAATPKATPTSKHRSFSSTSIGTGRLHDPDHPPVIVHKHSKAMAFSLRRQHRPGPSSSANSGTFITSGGSGGKGNANVSTSASSSSTPKTSFSKKPVGPAAGSPRQSSSSASTAQAESRSRSHVFMLAQRTVQEAFTNTEIMRKVVLDQHQAIMAAFVPGLPRPGKSNVNGKGEERESEREVRKGGGSAVDSSMKPLGLSSRRKGSEEKDLSLLKERSGIDEKENQKKRLNLRKKSSASSKLGERGRVQATSEGQIETRNGAGVDLDWVLGSFRVVKGDPSSPSSTKGVGTRSAPVQSSDVDEGLVDLEVTGEDGLGREHISNNSSHTQPAPQESTPDRPQRSRRRMPSFSSQPHVTETVSFKSSILKRLLPWDTSSSSSSSSRLSSTVGVVSTGSSSTAITTTTTNGSTKTFLSVTSTSTTPTTTVSSELGNSFAPPSPWVAEPAHDPRKAQRKLLDSLERSLEDVGFVPPIKERVKTKRKSSFNEANNTVSGKGKPNNKAGVPKNDVLSCVPHDSLFMLLPLWPGETDLHSQRSFPFEAPHLPLEDRRFLLVFYKALSPIILENSASNSSQIPDTLRDKHSILLPGFHVIARQVTFSELQGTGVRVPDEGLAVSGPLEEAYQHLPINCPQSTSSAERADNEENVIRDCVIGSCYSRDAGLEFDPQALVELGLCMELTRENRLLPPGTVVEQFDSEQQMTVKLTPIGNAVMEMVWIGGLALMSFGPG